MFSYKFGDIIGATINIEIDILNYRIMQSRVIQCLSKLHAITRQTRIGHCTGFIGDVSQRQIIIANGTREIEYKYLIAIWYQ